MEKDLSLNSAENTINISDISTANGHDIFNYTARYRMANFQIQTVMTLNGRLDHSRLIKAVRLSLDAEPVFRCRFVENEPPYWKLIEDINNTMFCTFEETDNPDEAIKRFLESPLDMDNDPMVKLRLLSCGSYDTLCLKINHTCCDGTGTKEYIRLLSDIYSHIGQNNDFFTPRTRIRGRNDQDRLFKALGIKDPESAWTGELETPKKMFAFPWQPGKPANTRVAVCRLPSGHVDIMSRYAKGRGATINDLIITALYRAMFEISQPEQGVPMDISMTVDLRRYLPDRKTEAIRNFSGEIYLKLARFEHESFEGTLSRVVPMMNNLKSGRPGLQSAIGLERVEKANFSEILSYYTAETQKATDTDTCLPMLSNLGFIDKSLIKFGEAVVTDAYIVPPVLCPPRLLLCTGTYNGILTTAVSYYEARASRVYIDRLINLIKDELVTGCTL
jgi:NRPS condensation-like uncharacterized protein